VNLQARIADALGWTMAEVQSFSLPALRELVRAVDPALGHEINVVMRRAGEYIATAYARRGR
jgi:hypothetical protein